MKKHTSEEAYYGRLRNLAMVNKTVVKESQNRNLGTLIDYKRAADGIAYGIIKENHNYYIKKAGLKSDPNIADFAYIGGLANISEFEYNRLSEAEKQRNMLFRTINEAVTTKPTKIGSKKRLNEDKAGEEIEASQEMAAGLDAANDNSSTSEPEQTPDFGGDPENGLETPAPTEEPIPNSGAEEETPPTDIATDEVPADETPADETPATDDDNETPETSGEGNSEDSKDITTKEIEKGLGKLTEKIRKTEMTDSQVKSYVNSFLSAFKDKFPDVEIEDRKAMAEKITKVVPDEEIENLGQNVEDTEGATKEVAEEQEEQCAECGGFAKFAESRGYNAQSIQECGEEEMTNLVSGYANAHNDGQNDGDLKVVALFITPEIIDKLKSDYGHDDYAEKLTPYTNELSENSAEEKEAQINELFGGLGFLGKKASQAVAGGAKKLYQAGAEKAGQVKQAVGNAATQIKQGYYAGEKNASLNKLQTIAADLGKQIATVNTNATKAGQEPINVNSILMTIKNQVGKTGTADLSKFRTAEGLDDAAKIETQPIEEIEVPELKKGQKLNASAPVKQIKEDEEPESEEIENDDEKEKSEINFAPAGETLGGGIVKPEGAGVEIKIEPDKSINISMNESEKKLRKYVQNRLEELSGKKKPLLSENKKSEKLKKLDSIIDKQFKLYESTVIKKKSEVNEIFGLSIKEKFAKINPQDAASVEALFVSAFRDILNNPQFTTIGRAAKTTPTNLKYDILKQYVEQGGGTLRLANSKTVKFAPDSVKQDATPNPFAGGGTGGNFSYGGSTGS